MRLSELSAASGVSTATIKYYLREGLLSPGRSRSATQADYDDSHLAALRLVRALVDVGGLSIASVREVLTALDGPGGVAEAVGVAHGALAPRAATGGATDRARAALRTLGWEVSDSPALHQLETALAAADEVGLGAGDEVLRAYGEAAMTVARRDVSAMAAGPLPGGDPVRYAVLGTVLYEPVLLALRRLAQQVVFTSGGTPGPTAP